MKNILKSLKSPETSRLGLWLKSIGLPLEPLPPIEARPDEKVGANKTIGPGGWREFVFGVGYKKP